MAAGRTCLIISFPMLATLAALALGVFVAVGDTKDSSFLPDLWFMRIDTSDLSVTATEGSSSVTVSVPSSFPDFYTTGLWSYCYGNTSAGSDAVTACTKPSANYYFNPLQIIEDTLDVTVADVSDGVTNAIKSVKKASQAMIALYIIAVVLSFVELVTSVCALHSRFTSCCNFLLGLVAAAAFIAASVMSTVLYLLMKKAFNDSALNVTVTLNHTMYGLTWGGALASALAAVFWLFSIFCGSTRRSHSEKALVYEPVNHY
ncbi:actin cortical patch SUR7/pH-response regulator pali [Dipodascopsis tothii]|uniref:actin cortical patch SUR7/pH-response regulator pali n=1 Tax=Dipodascopsis tothii TaxID=44089 RepID=UPI0034CE2ACC